MSDARAYMRVLGGDEIPLDMLDLDNDAVWFVQVPAFGTLIAMRADDHPNAPWAIVSQGPGTDRTFPATRVDGRIEVELLHKADRLCVVIEP